MDNRLYLIKQIINRYQNNDYLGTIKAFEEYLNIKEQQGIYGEIYNIYINCLIRLGLFEEAKKHLKIMIELFPKNYTPAELANRYLACEMYEEAKNIINTKKITAVEYYKLGKNYFYKQQYDKATHCLGLAIKENPDLINKADFYLRRIKIHKKNNDIFKPVRYYTFKSYGNKLEPGHVIRADRLRDKYKCNLNNEDPYKHNRAFLIWHIEGNCIYVFPLSTRLRYDHRDGHIISKDKYLNYEVDRRLQDRILCVKESDVLYVDDKIDSEDYQNIIDKIYKICCYNHSLPRDNIKRFMIKMAQDGRVEPKDIITINHYDYKSNYFVLEKDTDKQEYLTLEVERDNDGYFSLVSKELIKLSFDSRIEDIIKLNCNQVGSLYEEINQTSYTKRKQRKTK